MKPVKRIFFMLGVLSVFSLFQFDAMAKCTSTPGAGKYCQNSTRKNCLPGCFCIGSGSDPVGIADDKLKSFCIYKETPTSAQETKMNQAGIYLCPKEEQFSVEGTKKEADCKAREFCNTEPSKGKYCRVKHGDNGSVVLNCPAGCWCGDDGNRQLAVGYGNPFDDGRIDLPSWCNNQIDNNTQLEAYLNERGVHHCPKDFSHSDAGSTKQSDCYAKANETGSGKMFLGQVSCAAGQYLKKGTPRTGGCVLCEKNHFCKGGTYIVSYKEDKGTESCPEQYPYTSAMGKASITDCVNESGQHYVEPAPTNNEDPQSEGDPGAGDTTETPCPKGQYLFRRMFCKACEAGYVCPDGENRQSVASYCDQDSQIVNADRTGCKNCHPGEKPNEQQTECIRDNTSLTKPININTYNNRPSINPLVIGGGEEHECQTNEYYDATNNDCVHCQNGVNEAGNGCIQSGGGEEHECVQDQYHYFDATNNDCVHCQNGVNETGDGCVQNEDTCGAGKYLDEDGICTGCEPTYFCPGNQHKYPCPFGTSGGSNEGKSCAFNLGADTLRKGKSSNKECWKLKDAKYRLCVYGIDLGDYYIH